MIEILRGIILDRVRHNDKLEIVSMYTLERGRVAFAVPSGSTRAGRMRRGMMMPLSVVEVGVNYSATKDIQRLIALNVLRQFPSLYDNPYKSAVGFFLREFLSRLLREYPVDASLWTFIVRYLDILNQCPPSTTANFHILFLCALTDPLGIRPDTFHSDDRPYFDMRNGEYTSTPPLHSDYLKGEEALLPSILSRLTPYNAERWRLGRDQRRRILEGILHYYSLHYSGISQLKSTDILRALFD